MSPAIKVPPGEWNAERVRAFNAAAPIRFTSPGKPLGVNHAYAVARWGNRAGIRKTAEAHAYAERLAGDARRCRPKPKPLEGAVEVRLGFVYPDRRSDIDGAIKLTLDALAGIAYRNDRQIERLIVERFVDAERPRVEFEAQLLEGSPFVNCWDEGWKGWRLAA